MAKLKRGILGPISGKLGTVVGGLSKGKLPELSSSIAFLSAPDTLQLNWLATESDKTSV